MLLESEFQPWAVLLLPVVLGLSALTFSAALFPLPRSSPAKGVGDGLGVDVGVVVAVGVDVAIGVGVGLRSLSARALCENAKQASASSAIAVVSLIDVFICFVVFIYFLSGNCGLKFSRIFRNWNNPSFEQTPAYRAKAAIFRIMESTMAYRGFLRPGRSALV